MKFTDTANNNHRSRWSEAVFSEQIEVRVLIVADGKIKFDESGLGLTDLIKALNESVFPWEKLVITTAHRNSETSGAQLPNFRFDSNTHPFSIEHYEQLWLFGYEGEDSEFSLEPKQLKIITEFMNAGGGVFATGDHQDLGFALCGKLPRVRSMRKWSFKEKSLVLKAPDRNGPTRIDTLRMGTTGGFQEGDQRDSTPQQICPKFFLDDSGSAAYPHPVLADGDFAISILPDHMHEGECILPSTLEDKYQFDGEEPKYEYPEMLNVPARISPVVVAVSTSASGLVDLSVQPPILPVEPKCFKIITAYDGHYIKDLSSGKVVKLGRIVADASFHHFVNLNLDGFIKENKPELEVIKRYYRNLLTWLMPAKFQHHYCLNLLLAVRFNPELIEEFETNSDFRWEQILDAGTVTWGAIAKAFSTAEARMCAIRTAGLLPDEIRSLTKGYLDPWVSISQPNGRPKVLLDPKVVPLIILGSAILGIVSKLPDDSHKAAEKLESEPEYLQNIVKEGLMRGMVCFNGVLKKSNDALIDVVNSLSAVLDQSDAPA